MVFTGGVTHTNLANDEKTTVNEFLIPQRFPENETSVVFNDEKIRVVPYHNGTFSPNILKTLEFTVVQMTVEKYNTGKSVKNYRCRYEEIIRNTSDPIMKIMNGLNAKSAINCNDKLLIIPLESHGLYFFFIVITFLEMMIACKSQHQFRSLICMRISILENSCG